MACIMAKHVNKHTYLPIVSILMIMSAFVLTVIYFSVYKAAIKSLNQRLKQSRETYTEQQNMLNRFHRLNRIKLINLQAQKIHQKEITKFQNSIRFSKGLLFISSIFFLTCFPFGSVQIIDEFYRLPSFLHLYTFILTRLCSLLNPIFYGIYSSTFLFGYKNVLNVIIHRRRLIFRKYEEERKKAKN